ncbi:two-component system activity regulator YycH [Paenibacillus chungangensis]|uniref:Two-component system activity regulator YycH n=1 Tax=Paenibacillus chungangensis TaxID=696535 RepID=A0ABW3HW91_9BACL
MMERMKTALLVVLVALSLLQSYFLAYRMPGLGATVRSDQDYVHAEPLGKPASVEEMIFPNELILHRGDNKHTVIYPGMQFYDMILKQRIAGREFKGFQRSPASLMDWEYIREKEIGVELRFDGGISIELLQKLLKVEGDPLFLNERIDRIWIFKTTATEEVRTFFFSNDGLTVYESIRADLTIRDVQDYVGFGEYMPAYRITKDGLYIPETFLQATEVIMPYETYSPQQIQRSLFDPGTTIAWEDRGGSQIITDGKRGLQVKQNGTWISYTNPAATKSSDVELSENVYASIDFINQHGGWDGSHRLMGLQPAQEQKYVQFRQYIEQYPVVGDPYFQYGYMRLVLQKGVVTEYERSLITLSSRSESRKERWLQGGDQLEDRLKRYERVNEVASVYPALKARPLEDQRMSLTPVWVARHRDGTETVLSEALPAGFKPPQEGAAARDIEASSEGASQEGAAANRSESDNDQSVDQRQGRGLEEDQDEERLEVAE